MPPVCLGAPYVWTPPVCLEALHMFGCPPVCLDATKSMGASKGIRDIQTYGGVQKYRSSQMYGVHMDTPSV